MTREELRAIWRARVTAFQASSLSMKAWCTAEGVTVAQLNYWLRHLAPKSSCEDSAIIPWQAMTVVGESVAPSSSLRVHVGPGVVEVHSGFDRALLAEVVRVLEALC